ncbi:MAG: ATP-binding protein, partial [Pseudomonadota bacterium]|nr:ATP-binding protein [Pseudomonadota bacterium]
VSRMQDVIRGQLNKATLAAPAALGQRTAAEELLMRLVSALRTVYPNVHIQTRFNATGPLRGDASDLMEIFGNVLENACKFCRGRVIVELAAEDLRQSAQAKLRVTIEDDGAGIAVDDRQQVVQRGQRADSQAPGQGIGLSVTAELVDLYQGELTISDSDLGGARICITLPGFDPVQ